MLAPGEGTRAHSLAKKHSGGHLGIGGSISAGLLEVDADLPICGALHGIERKRGAQQVAADAFESFAVAAINRGDTRRAVLVMHELDGFSIPEIAAAIEAPINTLYSHLRRARKEFREAARELGLYREGRDG